MSLEKTKVTHLDDGFDFLGFQLRRSMGAEGMGVKTTIADKAMRRHLDYLRAATAPGRTDDAVVAKIGALNHAIAGWCRYFQYTSRASAQFHQMEHKAFWMVAHWLARKHKLSIAQTLCRFNQGGGLGTEGVHLLRHSSFPALSYRERFFKPNPYTTRERIEREELPETDPWRGYEERPGMADLRPRVIRRDGSRCQRCGCTGDGGHLRGRSPTPGQGLQTAGRCERRGEPVDAVHPLSPGEDRDGPTEGKPDAVKVARPVWRGGSGDVPMRAAHAVKRTLPEVTRPAPTRPFGWLGAAAAAGAL